MGLLNSILGINSGSIIRELAKVLGISDNVALEAVSKLVPALSRGLDINSLTPDGLKDLVSALTSGDHSRFVDNPELLEDPGAAEEGNSILQHILGSKDASRNVAGYVSEQTGTSSDILKKALPLVAAATMGTLGKQVLGSGETDSNAGNLIKSLIGSDDDDVGLDDVLSLAKKFF